MIKVLLRMTNNKRINLFCYDQFGTVILIVNCPLSIVNYLDLQFAQKLV